MSKNAHKENLFTILRNLIFPPTIIDGYLPKSGRFLDVGCGHGTLAAHLAKSKQRMVLGIDPSPTKIREARILHPQTVNLKYQIGYLSQIKNKFNAITIVDVLYLLPTGKKLEMLRTARKVLTRKGILILKETKRNIWLAAEEFLMKKLGLTYSDYQKNYFTNTQKYRELIKKAGFEIKKEVEFTRFIFYSQILFLCQTKSSGNQLSTGGAR